MEKRKRNMYSFMSAATIDSLFFYKSNKNVSQEFGDLKHNHTKCWKFVLKFSGAEGKIE